MLKKFCFLTTTLAIVATFGAVAKAETPADQKASPTPTAKPQNQTSSLNAAARASATPPTFGRPIYHDACSISDAEAEIAKGIEGG